MTILQVEAIAGGLGGLGLLVCVGGIVLVLAAALVMIFNRLVVLKNRVDNAWAQIDVQLKRRADLIPNLVESVKGYMKHEKGVLEEVTKARTALMQAGTVEEKAKANNMLAGTLKTLFAVAENYPQLKASENFKMLQEELAGTENKIAYARTAYNDSVLEYNQTIQVIPYNLFAGMFGHAQKQYFGVTEAERQNVKVQF
ncbi:MAG: LemA family protein [Candidatus Micrarchaeia archaeon]|jgi:LemA protein